MREPSPPGNAPGARTANRVLAALYFLLAGMVLYFRFVPYARVVRRFRDEGTTVPSWYGWGGTAVLVGVAVFLVWRGSRFLRQG